MRKGILGIYILLGGYDMDEFYYEEEKPNNVFIKCLVILFLIGILGGAFIYYKKENTVRIKNVTVEVGSKLSTNINDYLKKGNKFSSKYKLYLDGVDINTVGKYVYKVKYNKHIKKGYINVQDTKAPDVILDDNVIIGKDIKLDPSIFVLKCEDYSLPCSVNLKNKNDVSKIDDIGEYNIDIVISDSANNKLTKTVKLIVDDVDSIYSKSTNDLDYYTNSDDDENLKHTLFVSLDNAISEESEEFEKLFLDVSSTNFSDYVDDSIYSTRIITAYNKYGYVIGLQVEVTFKNGTKKLLNGKVD